MENLNVVELKQEELLCIEGGQDGRPEGNGYSGSGVLDVIEAVGDWCCLWQV